MSCAAPVRWVVALCLLLAVPAAGYAGQIAVDTSSLSRWKAITFPWVGRHSQYTIVEENGKGVIHLESDNSASSLEYEQTFQTYQTPNLHWSWKVMNIIPSGNAETEQGDDYAARIFVMFPYDPKRASFSERVRHNMLKQLLGYYPALEILNYVWANRPHARNPIPNAFEGRGIMFFADVGTTYLGRWRSHHVNIVADYRKAFDRAPPATFTVAIMADSDNTHGSTSAYIKNIYLSSED